MKRIHFKNIHSTHLYAKENLHNFKNYSEVIITADYQTGGIGRRMDKWISPANHSLLTTYIYNAPPLYFCPHLSKIASLSLKQALDPLRLPITFKEPNDLLINEKKFCGILSEICGDKMLTSIGLNIFQTQKDLKDIDQKATSLFLETGKKHSKEKILLEFLFYFKKDISLKMGALQSPDGF